jgi:pyrroline-5-carboxylate reductase
MMSKVALIGVGKMGEAILAGLCRTLSVKDIVITVRRAERAAELQSTYAVQVLNNKDAFATADYIFVLVKPHDVIALLQENSQHLRPGTVVVSLAAGLPSAKLEAALPSGTPVVRVMPNTPSLVGEGMSIISAGSNCSDAQMAEVTELLESIGKTVNVDEAYQDSMTAISGSGPAYFFYVVEAMIAAGVAMGIDAAIAKELAVQTIVGSAKLLEETGADPEELRMNVTSKGGVTAAAIAHFDERELKLIFQQALEAARKRSIEMASS